MRHCIDLVYLVNTCHYFSIIGITGYSMSARTWTSNTGSHHACGNHALPKVAVKAMPAWLKNRERFSQFQAILGSIFEALSKPSACLYSRIITVYMPGRSIECFDPPLPSDNPFLRD